MVSGFSGKVLQETSDSVVFESELAGPVTVARTKIRELQRSHPAHVPNASTLTNLG